MNKFSESKKRKLLLYCIIACAILTFACIFNSIRFGNSTVSLNGMEIEINSVNGCLQTLSFLLCIGMVFLSPTVGLYSALVVISFSLVGLIRSMIMDKTIAPMPGALNGLCFFFATVIFARNIKRKEKESVIDEITGLNNTSDFEYQLYKKINHNERGYLLLIHVEGLSQVNINLGRELGNVVFKIISDRITDLVGSDSRAFKIEGSDYAVLLDAEENVIDIEKKLIQTIEAPILLEKGNLKTNCFVSAYIGEANFLNRDISAENLVKQADIAMTYARKSAKGVKICSFNSKMREMIEREAKVEGLIKESLKNDYFYLVYQPQYSTEEKQLRGFETLIRMKTPKGENISPGEFITVAEKSDLIIDIDQLVIRRALKEFKDICIMSGNKMTIAINISAKDIARAGFADRLIGIVEEMEFPPECLEIEITEYSFAGSQSHTIENIRKLREHHVMIALDDFGTGYTSLEQVIKLPINLVKLDKSLIDDVASSKHNTDFVKTVIYMGHLMEAEVIAEGVEFSYQLAMLKLLQCDFIQGFLWGRPMEYEQAREHALAKIEDMQKQDD